MKNDKLYENFKTHFPYIAQTVKGWYRSGRYEVTAALTNGDRVLYDDYEKTIRTLPRDRNGLTEKECREEFSKRLCKIMRRLRVSQTDLSTLTGIAQPALSRYINGVSMPSFYNVDKIAKALDCSMDDLRYT